MIVKSPIAPFIKREETVSSMMKNMLVALCCLLVLPTVRHGVRPVQLALVSVGACFLTEVICCLLAKREINTSELSPLVTGMVIAMLMPVNAPLWLPALAGAFAVAVVRAPFGFTGRTPFNPAAAGVSFVTLCFPGLMFDYGQPSPTAVLKQGLTPDILPFEMLWGNLPGPMGTTAIAVVAACGLYLFLTRTSSWQITAAFLAAAALTALFFPRIFSGTINSVKYELLSGSLLFCAVFMITDPVTAPRTATGSVLYGFFGGAAVLLFRWFGVYEQGACFAVLLMNAFAPVIDWCVCAVKIGRVRRSHE